MPPQFFCAHAVRCCSAARSFGVLKAFAAASAYSWKTFASFRSLVSALPEVVWSVWASFVPSAMSCAQFFDVASFGAAELDVVVEPADVVGDADFLLDPPQPAPTKTHATASTARSLDPTAGRV